MRRGSPLMPCCWHGSSYDKGAMPILRCRRSSVTCCLHAACGRLQRSQKHIWATDSGCNPVQARKCKSSDWFGLERCGEGFLLSERRLSGVRCPLADRCLARRVDISESVAIQVRAGKGRPSVSCIKERRLGRRSRCKFG